MKQLRQIVERYPYYQAARMLLLRALYEAHDPAFGQELRRSALYVPSRRVLYELIEADHLRPKPQSRVHRMIEDIDEANADRTNSLIDNFLTSSDAEQPKPQRRHNTRPMVDAATDYMEYMQQIETENTNLSETEPERLQKSSSSQQIIDDFLVQGRITIQEHPDEELQKPQIEDESSSNDEYLTETLARIYIKQGKYDKAIEIIQRLSLKYPKKNRYFADQIRYLGKLIVNNNNK